MKDIIKNLQKYHAWKIQLTMAINFISFKDTDEEHVMNSKSDNVEIMILNYFFNRSQNGLETSIKGSNFIFYCINLLYLLHYRCHKINQSYQLNKKQKRNN